MSSLGSTNYFWHYSVDTWGTSRYPQNIPADKVTEEVLRCGENLSLLIGWPAHSGVEVNMANDALKIVTHEDVEQAKRPIVRTGSTTPVEAVDPAKLMDMLGDIDGLKREIQDRVRRIEAVKQAKSLLVEDALRTEALNKRLAEIGKVMSAVHSGILDTELDAAEALPVQGREVAAQVEARQATVKVINESVALPWPKLEEIASAVTAAEEAEAELKAAEVLDEPLEFSVQDVDEHGVVEPVAEVVAERHDLESVTVDEEPEVLSIVEQALPAAESLNRAEELVAEARRLLEESSARLDLAVNREEQAALDLQSAQQTVATTYESATERLAEAERHWKLANDAALEARRLFDDSTSQLTLAVGKEQQSSADFHSAQRALTAAYQAACQRLEAAEQYSKDGDGFAQETRKLLEQVQAELAEARSGAASATEDLLSARQELTTAYQFASVAAQRRMDSAQFFRKTSNWVVFSTAFAWMAAVWLAWVAFNRVVPILVPFAAACVILAGAIYLRRRGAREIEET